VYAMSASSVGASASSSGSGAGRAHLGECVKVRHPQVLCVEVDMAVDVESTLAVVSLDRFEAMSARV